MQKPESAEHGKHSFTSRRTRPRAGTDSGLGLVTFAFQEEGEMLGG